MNEAERMRKMGLAFQDLAKGLGEIIQRQGIALTRVGRIMHDAMWKAYGDAGKPYGDSEDGMWRWMNREARARNLELEAEEIRSTHAALARLRGGRHG